jgi:anthranilate synthase component 1
LVGYLGYEIVRRLEKLPDLSKKDIDIPEIAMMLTSDLAVYDHKESAITLIANAINWDGSSDRVDLAYEKAIERLDKMELELNQTLLSKFKEIPTRVAPN